MVEVDDLVFAKVKGYHPWPARVTGLVTGPASASAMAKIEVFFFGTYQTAQVRKEDVWLYNERTKQIWGKKKNKSFQKSIDEIENNPEIFEKPAPAPVDRKSPPTSVKKIPPKKSTTASSTTPCPLSKKRGRKPHYKLYVQVKDTGDLIEIDLDKNRPHHPSKQAALDWEKINYKKALIFKKMVESGDYIPEEVIKKLETKSHNSLEEIAILEKHKTLGIDRKQKMKWLKDEANIIDIEVNLRRSLHPDTPNLERCVDLLNELSILPISALMLKKQPQVVDTMNKIQRYAGPRHPNPELEPEIMRIRIKANAIYSKFQASFDNFDDQNSVDFLQYFDAQVQELKDKTENWPKEKVTCLVSDPTKLVST